MQGVLVWGCMKRRGRRGSLESALNKKMTCFYLFFYFNIYINWSFFFHPPYLLSFFFLHQVHFPCKYFSFLCVCYFFLWFFSSSIIRRTPSRWMWRTGWTSQCPPALSCWKRWLWDWPRWTATRPSCEGWARPLRGTSSRSVLLLGAGACVHKKEEHK